MRKSIKHLIIGISATGLLGTANFVFAEAPNPMQYCVNTSSSFPTKYPGTAILVAANTQDVTTPSLPGWSYNKSMNIPARGTQVCFPTPSWTDANMRYNDTFKYSTLVYIGGYYYCTNKNLVTKRSQVGPGIQYSLHFNLIPNGSGGIACEVSNVRVW